MLWSRCGGLSLLLVKVVDLSIPNTLEIVGSFGRDT